jgi:hypothetical protein
MSDTEWKNGYEAGFAAGWKAAKSELPGVYNITPNASFSTMNDQPYNVKTNVELGTITLTEQKKKPDLRVISNLTDHTRIV